MKNRTFVALAFLALMPFFASNARADEQCTLVYDVTANELVHESGTICDDRFSPASTFKIAIALMGFEEGILNSPKSPAIEYDPAINAHFKSWRQTTTPELWLKNSVIWYSRVVTNVLQMNKFKKYVAQFSYGNQDVSGDKGQNNGLTHAWLSSSLKISPREQLAFLRKVDDRSLNLSDATNELLDATITKFETGLGTVVKGKT